jgi:hypothetical protein
LTIWDNFKKGLEQIQNSDAKTGFVLFNLKNLISLDEVWPVVAKETPGDSTGSTLMAWPNYQAPASLLRQKVDNVMADLVNAVGKPNYIDAVSPFDAVRVPVFLLYTGTGIVINNSPVLTCLRQLATGGELTKQEEKMLHRFNRALHLKRSFVRVISNFLWSISLLFRSKFSAD